MAGILEKMGLVRTEEVPLVTPLGNIVPQVEPENTPEIDASQVSYEDVIHSIYQQGGVEDTHSIFKIKAYIDILPPEIHDLINDGGGRINVLEAAAQSIKDENDSIISEAEADIEHLKSLIEAAETKIADSKRKTAEANAAITEEINSITQLLNFADGIAGTTKGES